MRWARRLVLRSRPASCALADALLGPDHPLVQASDFLQSITRQSMVLALVLLGAVDGFIAGLAWAWTVVLGAGIALSILTVLAAGFQQSKRDQALDLILKGYQNVPIAAIQDQRRRLLSARTRLHLTRYLMHTAEEMRERMRSPAPRSEALPHPRTIADAIDDLLNVSHTLTTEEVSAHGVARAERLITDGTSPLHEHDLIALRAELRRIRDDLVAR